jgi:hypothetical protein
MATTAIGPNTLAGTAADFKVPSDTDIQAAERIKRQGAAPLGERQVPGVPPGAQPAPAALAAVTVAAKTTINHLIKKVEQRARLRVPPKYLVDTEGDSFNSVLAEFGGIIFPYTPQISYENSADWSEIKPLHSNFNIPFYQRSAVSNITLNAKFTVSNSKEADIYIATVHLLRALTKMRFGGSKGDVDSGSSPPICRLDAYGTDMLKNVPVAIKGVRIELPDSVDYFSADETFSVPIISTIAITLLPVYSRAEMQKFSVTGYLNKSLGEGYI